MSNDTRITMPDGLTFRSQSQRRYVVAEYLHGATCWSTSKRSDDVDKAVAWWAGLVRRGRTAHVVDTTQGKVIR
jgi:hypothetical protein